MRSQGYRGVGRQGLGLAGDRLRQLRLPGLHRHFFRRHVLHAARRGDPRFGRIQSLRVQFPAACGVR